MFSKFFAIIISLFFISGCVTTPEQAKQVGGGALAGALIGSLAGAAISPKGGGRRGDGAVRGAMGGAAIGALAGVYGMSQPQGRGSRYSYDSGYSYGGGSGSIPDHCQGYSDYRSQNICAQEAYRELASQQARARRAADQEARERGRSWRY
ncbi:MAG: hypothetical protein EOM19_02645 [Candidatus Moranbacteria bacterium]|nr:hypothetical protein [Candidatus Moranbacteria bacterium]